MSKSKKKKSNKAKKPNTVQTKKPAPKNKPEIRKKVEVNKQLEKHAKENKMNEVEDSPMIQEQTVKSPEKAKSSPSFLQKAFDMIGLKTKTDYAVCLVGATIIIALVILAILLFCGVFQTKESRAANVSYYGREESDFAVSLISASEEEQKTMSDEMKLDFDNAKFDFYSMTEYEYSDANPIFPLSLANPSYNDCILVFTITDGDGEILYRSLGVRPGYMLTYVSFSRNIPYGENDLKLYVTAFKEKEGKNETKYTKIGNSIATLKMTHTAVAESIDE